MNRLIWQGKIHVDAKQVRKDVIKSFKDDLGLVFIFTTLFVIQIFIGGFDKMDYFYLHLSMILILGGLAYMVVYKYMIHGKITYSLYPSEFIIQKKKETQSIKIKDIHTVYSSVNEKGIGKVHIHYLDLASKRQKEYIVRYLDDYKELTETLKSLINESD